MGILPLALIDGTRGKLHLGQNAARNAEAASPVQGTEIG